MIYDYININSDEVINKVELLDITGKTLSIENGNGMQTKKFELRQLAKGVYIVKVITTRGVFEQRLIKQ